MEAMIRKTLKELEQRENCRILLAVESGSRAWGFASPDSDYDVRFIYIRPCEEYLRLERGRDVIELPVDPVLDINGWDLDKTLRLLHRSNPTVFEWFASPIVYKSTPFAERFLPMAQRYFSSKKGLWHYLSMAERNNHAYLCGETVRAKKYFYVLRPVLACRWIMEKGTPPPMRFEELVESQLETGLKSTVRELLALKMHAPERREIPRIDALNEYLEKSFAEIRARIAQLPEEPKPGWDELDALFLFELRRGPNAEAGL